MYSLPGVGQPSSTHAALQMVWPWHESFDCSPGLRGPCTQFLLKAAAFSVGQMGLVVVVQGMVTFFGGQVYKDRVKVLSR